MRNRDNHKRWGLWALLSSCLLCVQAQEWQWLQTAGGKDADVPRQIVVDNTGSSYVVGAFNSSNCFFGNIPLTNTLQAGYPTWDGFLAKYDTAGGVQWAVKFGGTNDDRAAGIAVDADHNCHVTGWFNSTNFFIGGVTLTNYAPNGNLCLFVAKFDSSAHLLWAHSPGAGNDSRGSRIVVDSTGNIYVAGSFRGANSFGSSNLVAAGYGNIALLKYDPSGNLLWIRQAGGNTGPDSPGGLALDSANNVYLLANIRSTNAAFGSLVFSVAGTNTCQNMVVAKYDPAGNVLWGKKYGGTSIDGGAGIAIGPGTNCYLTGSFCSTNLAFGSTTLHSSGDLVSADIFVAVLDYFGNPFSAWAVHGDETHASTDIAVDPVGNCYVSGFFQGTNLVFDSGWLSSVTLTNSETHYLNAADAFIAKFDARGNTIHVFQAAGLADQRAFSVAVDGSSTPFVTGWTMGTNVEFGNFAATNAYLDVFVAKLDPCLPVLQIVDGNLTAPGDAAAVTLSWPSLQTGSAVGHVECSTNLLNWIPASTFQSVIGGGQYYQVILKTGAAVYYRLRLSD